MHIDDQKLFRIYRTWLKKLKLNKIINEILNQTIWSFFFVPESHPIRYSVKSVFRSLIKN